jgi:hypothetical protein
MARHSVEPRGVKSQKKGGRILILYHRTYDQKDGLLIVVSDGLFFAAGAMTLGVLRSMAFFVGYRSSFASTDRGRLMISFVSFVRYVSPLRQNELNYVRVAVF